MAEFATVAELADFLGTDIEDDDPKALLVLAAASAACQIYTRQTLELVEDDVAVLRGNWSGVLELPEQPVGEVSAVSIDSVGVANPVPDFLLRPGGRLLIGPAVEVMWGPDPDGWQWGGPDSAITVTYTHGFDPELHLAQWSAVKSATLMIAARLWERPGSGASVQSETIGAYAYALGQRAVAEGLVGPERALLDNFRRVVTSVAT